MTAAFLYCDGYFERMDSALLAFSGVKAKGVLSASDERCYGAYNHVRFAPYVCCRNRRTTKSLSEYERRRWAPGRWAAGRERRRRSESVNPRSISLSSNVFRVASYMQDKLQMFEARHFPLGKGKTGSLVVHSVSIGWRCSACVWFLLLVFASLVVWQRDRR